MVVACNFNTNNFSFFKEKKFKKFKIQYNTIFARYEGGFIKKNKFNKYNFTYNKNLNNFIFNFNDF